MVFSDRVYNILKWVIAIVLPAVATATIAVGQVFGWQSYTDPISKCIAIAQTLLGAIFCVGNATYYAQQEQGSITLKAHEGVDEQ